MSFNVGGLEIIIILLLALLAWGLPIAALVWFVRSFNELRDTVRRIEERLERSG
jgi:uncharacterized integral membrane protein